MASSLSTSDRQSKSSFHMSLVLKQFVTQLLRTCGLVAQSKSTSKLEDHDPKIVYIK